MRTFLTILFTLVLIKIHTIKGGVLVGRDASWTELSRGEWVPTKVCTWKIGKDAVKICAYEHEVVSVERVELQEEEK